MNNYSVELTNGIELLVFGNNANDALQNAQSEAQKMNQQVMGEAELLNCSIS